MSTFTDRTYWAARDTDQQVRRRKKADRQQAQANARAVATRRLEQAMRDVEWDTWVQTAPGIEGGRNHD